MTKRPTRTFALLIGALLFSFNAKAKEEVLVAITSLHPPYVVNQDTSIGLAFDFFGVLNKAQDRYQFSVFSVPVIPFPLKGFSSRKTS